MTNGCYVPLSGRGVITVAGADREAFLQGLVSNDVARCAAGRAVWAALLTPQGRYLHDFFMVRRAEALWLDCEGGDRLMDLGGRLRRPVLRSDVQLGIGQGLRHYALLNVSGDLFGLSEEDGAVLDLPDGVLFRDPRLGAAGLRLVAPQEEAEVLFAAHGLPEADEALYHQTRIRLGLPDGSRDMEPEKALLLECGFDELDGVDWRKGCYMGQEVTARMRYRGLVKKRLLPLRLAEGGTPPALGTPVMAGEVEVGVSCSSCDGYALALLRLDRWRSAEEQDQPLQIGQCTAAVEKPDWLHLPDEAGSQTPQPSPQSH